MTNLRLLSGRAGRGRAGRLARIGCQILLLAGAAAGAALAMADHLRSASPADALSWWPTHSSALVSLSTSALASGETAAAERLAREALRSDPLAPRALSVLAQAAARRGERDLAGARWALAAKRDGRDGVAQRALLARASAARDPAAVVDRIDALFRGQNPAAWDALGRMVVPLLVEPAVAPALAQALAHDPPWRRFALRLAAESAPDPLAAVTLFDAVQATALPPRLDEWRPMLERLVGAGHYDRAFGAFLALAPESQLGKGGLLFNGGWSAEPTDLPFDWVFDRAAGFLLALSGPPERRELRIDFLGGRVAFRHVRHLMMLPPGDYRLTGRESAALDSEVGLLWRVECLAEQAAGGKSVTLAETEILRGDVPWRGLAARFTVPSSACPVQKLELVLPYRSALDTETAGSVAYSDLAVERL